MRTPICSHQRLFQVVIILPIVYGSVMLLIKPAILLEWTRIFVPQGRRSKCHHYNATKAHSRQPLPPWASPPI